MEESLYAELLRALKVNKVPVLISWTKERRECREILARDRRNRWIDLGVIALFMVTAVLLPLDFILKWLCLAALLAGVLPVVYRTVRVGASVKARLIASDDALGDYTPAAILIVTFGGALADWVFYAAFIRGRSAWYTSLINRSSLAAAVGESLAGRSSVIVNVEVDFIADPNTFHVTTANEYVVRAARALEVSLPAFNPVERTGSFLRGEH